MPRRIFNYPSGFEQALREFFSYDPKTGIVKWIKSKPGVRAGREAGCIVTFENTQYLKVGFRGQELLIHRLAWFLYYGYWPDEVDHRDLNGLNNKIENLRNATSTFNKENQRKAHRHSKTGILGVSFDPSCNKFFARIGVAKKRIILGFFDTAEEAHMAYIEAKRKIHKGNTL